MDIVIIASAISTGGAVSILNAFISTVQQKKADDRYLFFIHSDYSAPAIPGVKFVSLRKSLLRRFYYDCIGFRKYIKALGYHPDVIISFQNNGIRFPGARQIVYYHQPLPLFKNFRWNPFKPGERMMWFHANVFPRYAKLFLSSVDNVIVQMPNLRTLFSERYRYPEANISVMRPTLSSIDPDAYTAYPFPDSYVHFFFPAANWKYKEHTTLVRALHCLRNSEPDLVKNIRIHFTLLDEAENSELLSLMKKYKLRENFVFHGTIPQSVAFTMYKGCAALLFPSVIETVGLPLIEAARFGKPVVASRIPILEEVIGDYEGVQFLPVHDFEAWAKAISTICHERPHFTPYKHRNDTPWTLKLLDFIHQPVAK